MENSCLCPSALYIGVTVDVREKAERACAFAHTHLSRTLRRTGESYAQHGCEVASVLRELTDDGSLLAVAILHDLLVHSEGEAILTQAPLSQEEKSLVREMHNLRRLHIDADTHDLDRVLDAFMNDPRMMLLRMAHRLNDVRHLDRFSEELRREIANETLHMYTAIAGRLGFHKWRYEMEDSCFALLFPTISESLQKKFSAHRKLDETCLDHTREFLMERLHDAGIPATIEGRVKGLYSTYRKMVVKNRSFEELTDRLALRIVVKHLDDCYRCLGVVHANMHPIPGKLKDYIGAPKENGYRSIHTVIYPLPGVTEQPIEIQIRTEAMHRECEEGVSAHNAYKNWNYALTSPPSRVALFRNLESLRMEARSPEQFEQALRTYFREDHLAVFDQENQLYHLKKPATALDFVCLAYGKRALRLKTLRINGRAQSPQTLLHDGDIVDTEFGKGISATKEWMHACKSKVAKKLIRDSMKEVVSKA